MANFSLVSLPSSPFWAEETTFDVPREFRQLSFFVHEKDWLKRSDTAVGKVALKRKDLHRYHGKDHWLALQAVDSDSEIYVGSPSSASTLAFCQGLCVCAGGGDR